MRLFKCYNVWEEEGWIEPDIKEDFDADRISLTLKFIKKQAIQNKFYPGVVIRFSGEKVLIG